MKTENMLGKQVSSFLGYGKLEDGYEIGSLGETVSDSEDSGVIMGRR